MSAFTFGYAVSSGLHRELGTDDSTTLFTTQRRERAVVAGERQFAALTGCLIRQSSITCSNGVREYDLLAGSTDFFRLAAQGPEYRHVSSNSTVSGSTRVAAGLDFPRSDIERLNREEPGWRESTGVEVPTGWYLRKEGGRLHIGLKEPPTIGSSESGTLTVPYVAVPEGSTESTRVLFAVSSNVESIELRPYYEAVLHYAAHDLEKLRRDTEASDRQLQKFSGFVARYLEDQRERTGHQRVSLYRSYFREARAGRAVPGSTGDPRR